MEEATKGLSTAEVFKRPDLSFYEIVNSARRIPIILLKTGLHVDYWNVSVCACFCVHQRLPVFSKSEIF